MEFKTGNLFEEDVEAMVNTVNCVGVMGRGIALQFKKAFPDNFKAYAEACKREEVQPGRMFVFETGSLTDPKYIRACASHSLRFALILYFVRHHSSRYRFI